MNTHDRLRRSVAPSIAALIGGCMLWAGLGSRPTASAQPAQPPAAGREHEAVKAELRPQVDQYLTLFGQGKIDEMLQRMPLPSGASRDEFETQRRQLAALYASAGRYSGFDVVGFQPLSSRYYQVYAIAYFEKQPALFEFGFYHPKAERANDWQVQHFHMRTDFTQFLDLLPVQRP